MRTIKLKRALANKHTNTHKQGKLGYIEIALKGTLSFGTNGNLLCDLLLQGTSTGKRKANTTLGKAQSVLNANGKKSE